jgi:hypothetical protein
MKVTVGSIWKCIDEDAQSFGRLCVVKYYNDNPDYNGDGDIILLYADGSVHYGKVRRFIPGVTHKIRRASK